MHRVMASWQEWWRNDGHRWAADGPYQEAGSHLLLMAFLQGIVDRGEGEGFLCHGQRRSIEREYGFGREVLELLICWKGERHAIQIMRRRDRESEQDGIHLLRNYLEQMGPWEGFLVLFDPRPARTWQQRLYTRKRQRGPHTIWVIGC
jgi:hypothetical protein